MFQKIFSSVSKWEDSFFGGYDGVVFDHPQVTVPNEIHYFPPAKTSHRLTYYTRDKLVRIFLNKVANNGLVPVLMQDFKVIENEEKRVALIGVKGIRQALMHVCAIETELSNLFLFYEDFLRDTQIEIDLPKEKKSSKQKEEGGSSEKKDKDDNTGNSDGSEDGESDCEKKEVEKGDLEKVIKSVEKTMNRIIVGRPSTYVYSDTKGLTNSELKGATKFEQMKKTAKACVYNADQIREANRLLSVLDINFDPKEDKVSNLKLGKVDIAKIAEIPCGNTHVYYKVEQNVSTRPFSVCILADESGSMLGSSPSSNSSVQNHLLKILYKTFSSILPPEKIYIYGHSGYNHPVIRVYNDKYNHNFEHTIDNQLRNDFGENYDGPVVENIYEKIRSHTNDNIIFISISDGEPWGHNYGGQNAKEELKRIIEKCKRDGFVTVGVGFRYTNVKDVYQYHTVIDNVTKDCAKQIGGLINQVVKSEFQC